MQKKVKEAISTYNLKSDQNIRYMDLVSEIGELGKEIIKGSDYGSLNYQNTPACEEELGDCLFSLFALCEELGLNANSALDLALQKYETRFNKNGTLNSTKK